MSNGLVVERKGKNSALKVTDPNGQKGGQQLLNDFVEQFALNLPKFMESGSKEKAQILLRIIGVGDKLVTLEREEQEHYIERLTIGRIADQKEKYAKEQPYYNDAPVELVLHRNSLRNSKTSWHRTSSCRKMGAFLLSELVV